MSEAIVIKFYSTLLDLIHYKNNILFKYNKISQYIKLHIVKPYITLFLFVLLVQRILYLQSGENCWLGGRKLVDTLNQVFLNRFFFLDMVHSGFFILFSVNPRAGLYSAKKRVPELVKYHHRVGSLEWNVSYITFSPWHIYIYFIRFLLLSLKNMITMWLIVSHAIYLGGYRMPNKKSEDDSPTPRNPWYPESDTDWCFGRVAGKCGKGLECEEDFANLLTREIGFGESRISGNRKGEAYQNRPEKIWYSRWSRHTGGLYERRDMLFHERLWKCEGKSRSKFHGDLVATPTQ